jgi:hydroxylysine kinase
MHPPLTAHSAVTEEPPRIDVIDLAQVVKEQFGLDGEYSPLISERDQNFHLKTAHGSQYVVKVTSVTEMPIVSEFQIEALLHLERGAMIRVPRVVRTTDGQSSGRVDHGERSFVLRVVSYLEGKQLEIIVVDADVARNFGINLARLDAALQGFSHEGENPVLLWDLQRIAELRNLLDHIEDLAVRGPVAAAIDDFERLVEPRLGSLRSQVIHGDANPENVLVDSSDHSVSGFIDFSDIVKAPLVIDVAIAASYLRAGNTDPLELISPFLAGYCSVLPLCDDELVLLFDLVRARLATTITILYWRLDSRDEDDPYRQKALASEGGAIRFLNALNTLGRERFLQRLEPKQQNISPPTT